MDEFVILGFTLIIAAVPGAMLGLGLLLGKWTPAIPSADPGRSRRWLGRTLLVSDAVMLAAGIVLVATRT